MCEKLLTNPIFSDMRLRNFLRMGYLLADKMGVSL